MTGTINQHAVRPAFLTFAGIVMVLMAIFFLCVAWRDYQERSWPVAEARILESSMHQTRKGYVLSFRYGYSVNQQAYTGKAEQSHTNIESAQSTLQSYAVNARLNVFYDPANAVYSRTQNRTLNDIVLGVYVGIMLIPGGILLIIFGANSRLRQKFQQLITSR